MADTDKTAPCTAPGCTARAAAGMRYCPGHGGTYLAGNEVGGFDERQGKPAAPRARRPDDACPHCWGNPCTCDDGMIDPDMGDR